MKNKNKVMKDLGKVRRRKIDIQKKTIIQDDIGQEFEDWVQWKTLWVEMNSLWGEAYYSAKAVNEENTIEFILKYVSFIDDIDSIDYRILFKEKYYDIKNIDYLKDDGLWVKIKALERGSNG